MLALSVEPVPGAATDLTSAAAPQEAADLGREKQGYQGGCAAQQS